MIPLTKLSTKVNPLLLNTLQKVYLVRANVLQNKKLQEQVIAPVFDQLNVYQDGKGISVLKKFDELFGLHEKFPEKQYELLNTSYTDAILITSILETNNLIKEIQEIITVFKQKEDSIDAGKLKVGRSNGAFIDMKIKKMYANWRAYLEPFVDNLNADIAKLQSVPLGSKLDSVNDKVNSLLTEQKEESILSELNKTFNLNLKPANDRIVALSEMSHLVELSATLSNLGSVLFKISNDVRFLSSGPRSGFGELTIPENEPGSSIMPGKVNPTQCESLTMVAGQVIGNHTAVTIANASALFESNSFKPLIGNNTLRSVKLLSDGIRSFRLNCAVGIEIIDNTIQENLKNYNNMI